LGDLRYSVFGDVFFYYFCQDPDLEFWEAALILSAVKYGGADNVVLHTFAPRLAGRLDKKNYCTVIN